MKADTPIPSRRTARLLITELGGFWALWGVAVSSIVFRWPPAIQGTSFIVAFVGVSAFYITYLRLWQPVMGMSGWKLAAMRSGPNSWRIMLNLLNLRWWAAVIRSSQWPSLATPVVLFGMLIVDLVLFGEYWSCNPGC